MNKINEKLDMNHIPKHIAIIMDGNGRWAERQNKPRSFGHQQGVEAVKKIAEEAARIGVKYLTLYTFSTENWKRPASEVSTLMKLIFNSLEEDLFIKNDIRFKVIGDRKRLPKEVNEALENCEEHTKNFKRMTIITALSYSSKWEMNEAVKNIALQVKEGSLQPEDITEERIDKELSTNFMPDPDLLIRTGGEFRLSNYLLWQCAYSELYFCDTYWPDFDAGELKKAILEYQQRERRFGKTSEQIENKK